MIAQLPALLIAIPLAAALLTPLTAFLSRKAPVWVAGLAVLTSHIISVYTLFEVLENGPWHYWFGGWEPPLGIEYVIDPMAAVMASFISFLSFMVLIYSRSFTADFDRIKRGAYYCLYLLVTVGLLGIVVTGDVFNLYVFLEVSSLSAYVLIAFGGKRGTFAALRYLLLGTIGASFYLMGIGILYALTGTLNMADMAVRLQPQMNAPVVVLALSMFVGGFGIKAGLFPMHGWLPDSYTYAYPPAIAFISGTMTKVYAYAVFRFFYYVFDPVNPLVGKTLSVFGILAAIGIIWGSVMAIAQKDFRRMLAYSSVAQIGYIILGFAIGNAYALIGAVYHILNHGLMKTCLFMIAGGIRKRTGETKIENFRGLRKFMPVTMMSIIIPAFSMIGIPPAPGFFSKWYLVLGAMEKDMWVYAAVIIISGLLNAVYFFRVIEVGIMSDPEETPQCFAEGGRELPYGMLVPIVILSAGVLVLGLAGGNLVDMVLQYTVPGVSF